MSFLGFLTNAAKNFDIDSPVIPIPSEATEEDVTKAEEEAGFWEKKAQTLGAFLRAKARVFKAQHELETAKIFYEEGYLDLKDAEYQANKRLRERRKKYRTQQRELQGWLI